MRRHGAAPARRAAPAAYEKKRGAPPWARRAAAIRTVNNRRRRRRRRRSRARYQSCSWPWFHASVQIRACAETREPCNLGGRSPGIPCRRQITRRSSTRCVPAEQALQRIRAILQACRITHRGAGLEPGCERVAGPWVGNPRTGWRLPSSARRHAVIAFRESRRPGRGVFSWTAPATRGIALPESRSEPERAGASWSEPGRK